VSSALDFLNSTGLQTAITLSVGTFVFVQYKIKKRDDIKLAANLVVTEIQGAERKIKNIKKRLTDGVLESDVSVITTNSWEKYRHLLSKFLDRDEWDAIEDFYSRALLLDDTIRYNNQMFRNDVEQIRINKQRAAADFAIDTVNNISNTTDREQVAEIFSAKLQVYDTLYMGKQREMAYAPTKIIDDAKKYIDNMPQLLNSVSVTKLKQVAKTGKSH